MLIGYAWVLTDEEAFDLQKEALDRAGVDRLYADVTIAADANRPQLEQALSQLRQGDILVVWKLDRLGRSVQHLIATVEDLTRRGIGFRSLKETSTRRPAWASSCSTRLAEPWLEFQSPPHPAQTGPDGREAPSPGAPQGPQVQAR